MRVLGAQTEIGVVTGYLDVDDLGSAIEGSWVLLSPYSEHDGPWLLPHSIDNNPFLEGDDIHRRNGLRYTPHLQDRMCGEINAYNPIIIGSNIGYFLFHNRKGGCLLLHLQETAEFPG